MIKRNIATGILAFLPSLRERGWGRGFFSLLIWFTIHCSFLTAQTERLEIPITQHDGLGKGIAEYAMNGLSFIDDWDTYIWKDIIPKPKGIPEDWAQARLGVEFLNQPQFIYQYTQSGQITEGYMQDSWLENAEFTETPIRCFLLFAEGVDPEGNRRFVVDQNNNQDLSDDIFFYADSIAFEKGRKEIRVLFDAYIEGGVMPQERTMYIGYDPHHQMYFGKVAEYATCEIGGTGYMLSPFGHNYMGYEDFEVIPLADISSDGHTHFAEQPIRKGNYLKIADGLFRFNGINVNRQVLMLEKDSRNPSEITALQTGFRLTPFVGNEFTSKDSISSDNYKGTTLLLMVFSPGCGSCIDKLAPMNEIYASIDSSKIKLVGLAIHTNEEHLTSVKEEHTIAFPLMIGEHGKINEAYTRLSTPTFLLINPEGIIIKKTFNLDEVKEALK